MVLPRDPRTASRARSKKTSSHHHRGTSAGIQRYRHRFGKPRHAVLKVADLIIAHPAERDIEHLGSVQGVVVVIPVVSSLLQLFPSGIHTFYDIILWPQRIRRNSGIGFRFRIRFGIRIGFWQCLFAEDSSHGPSAKASSDTCQWISSPRGRTI